MAGSAVPSDGLVLRGAPSAADQPRPGQSSAVVFRLKETELQNLEQAARAKDGLRFVTGNVPKLRLGNRTVELNVSEEVFRHELFVFTAGSSPTDQTYTAAVSHRAELKSTKPDPSYDTSGSDAALDALKNSLQSYEQEKEAKKANFSKAVLPTPKNRFDAARQEKKDRRRGLLRPGADSQANSPGHDGPPTLGVGSAPTSIPASENEVRLKAMKMAVVHLLAMGPCSDDKIRSLTLVPRDDLDGILHKTAELRDGKWELVKQSYRSLDVWKFPYPSKQERQAAIDNAVKAYDRLRMDKSDKLWQLLLKPEDRDKGIVLSNLSLHQPASQVKSGLTPHRVLSPLAQSDSAVDGQTASTSPPRKQEASTPRLGSSTMDVKKRLLSKNPQKARAAEVAKEKKRKEREEAANERESARPVKKRMTKKVATKPNIKSAEFVNSSDDDSSDDGDLAEENVSQVKKEKGGLKAAPAKSKPDISSSGSDGSDVPIKTVKKAAESAKEKAKLAGTRGVPAAKASTPSSLAKPSRAPAATDASPRSTVGQPRSSAAARATSASVLSTQGKSKQTAAQPGTQSNTSSPGDTIRPRVVSNASERSVVAKKPPNHHGTEPPKGLGITNGVRKRQDTVTSNAEPLDSSGSDKRKAPVKGKVNAATAGKFSAANGTTTPASKPKHLSNGNGKTHNEVEAVARPNAVSSANPASQRSAGTTPTAPGHRKTTSTSSQSQNRRPSDPGSGNSFAASNGTANTTPPAVLHSTTSASAGGYDVLSTITFNQGVALAEQFSDKYYPAYAKMYDEMKARERKGEKPDKEEMKRLWTMHRRLETMKREIMVASGREGGE